MIIPGNGTTITLMNKHLKPPKNCLKNSKKMKKCALSSDPDYFKKKSLFQKLYLTVHHLKTNTKNIKTTGH